MRKKVTSTDIAKAAGVSQATVSMAVSYTHLLYLSSAFTRPFCTIPEAALPE